MVRNRTFQKASREDMDAKGRADLLRCRVALLMGKDGELIRMYLDGSGTLSRVARLAGVSEAKVARRIHKLIRRLMDGQYITFLRNRDKFSDEQIEMARDYFVLGLQMSEIAEKHDASYYMVRQTMKRIGRLTNVTDNTTKKD
jgi:transposase-like protein